MLLELVEKLIDRIISLRKERMQSSQKLFDTIVHPSYADLEVLHTHNIEVFRNADLALTDMTVPIRLTVGRVFSEILLSQHMRNALLAVSQIDDPRIDVFLQEIAAYLTLPGDTRGTQRWFTGFSLVAMPILEYDDVLNGLPEHSRNNTDVLEEWLSCRLSPFKGENDDFPQEIEVQSEINVGNTFSSYTVPGADYLHYFMYARNALRESGGDTRHAMRIVLFQQLQAMQRAHLDVSIAYIKIKNGLC